MAFSEIIFECTAQELLPQGGVLCWRNSKKFLTFNALPGEKIRAKVIKKHKTLGKAIAIEILEPSPLRQQPLEEHFLSCSPWQIMPYDAEKKYKLELCYQIFKNQGIELPEGLELYSSDERFQYRNKMEYSIYHEPDGGNLSLSFYARDYKRKNCLDECILAHPSITKASKNVINWLNTVKNDVPYRSIKSLLLRSNSQGEVLGGLFVTTKDFPMPTSNFDMKSFAIYLSNPKSPASVIDETLYFNGDAVLTEQLLGKTFQYGLMSFFQIYPKTFEHALLGMKDYVQGNVLDYYSGVGSISIALSDNIEHSVLLDCTADSIEFAQKNLELNQLSHFETYLAPAEKMLEHIQSDKILILDPPRSGLHPKVIHRIINVLPKRVIYLSCNPVTCAENIKSILPYYNISFQHLYNFFPSTAHMEYLIILDKK